MSELEPRAVCYRCDKPERMCLCASVPRIDNRTGVFVLQHPRERGHHIGTARFASLGLSNARVDVAWNAGTIEDQPPAWLPPDAALLYPRDGARDLHEIPESEHPKNLVVIDGTWHTARTLYRDKTWLHALPHFRFSPAAPSRYRLRREPQADYVSTIEAIVEALRVLEPQTQGFEDLLRAFDAMIDAQAEHVARKEGGRRPRNRRPAAQRKIPHALVEAFDQLVVVYAESLRPGFETPRELIQVVAVALGSGETFERLLLPRAGVPSALLLQYMQLSPSDFDTACDTSAFTSAWQSFLARVGKAPGLAAWNQSSLDLIAAAVGGEPSRLSLKSAYRGLHGVSERGLDEVVKKEQLAPEALPFKGRAAIRIANAVAVARRMHERAFVV